MPSTTEAKFVLTAKDQTKSVFRKFRRNLDGIGKSVTGVQTQILALAGAGGFGAMVAGIISTNQEFQTLQASLKTVTGSAEGAEDAFKQIQEFAKTTPFALEQSVRAFIKLKSFGLEPSEKALKSYANTASAMGTSLDQMIEAVADAATGEFERLKAFGIRASKQGDEVTFTFQGVEKTIKATSENITQYLQDIGNVQFAGATDEQMKTLTASFSNFGDAVDNIQKQIGEAGLNDFVRDLTVDITDFLNSLDESEIRAFTQATMKEFAGLLDSVQSAYNYISNNQYLQASGIVGYMLFGKWGIGAALAIDKVNTMMGQDLAQNWDFLNESQVTGGTTNDADLGSYQLGDFNRSGGDREYLQLLREMNNKYGSGQLEQQKEMNGWLSEIADRLRDQTSEAVAG